MRSPTTKHDTHLKPTSRADGVIKLSLGKKQHVLLKPS